jgi:hypothetical protein
MTIVAAWRLSASDLRSLGNNLQAAVARDRHGLRAVGRSLAIHGESVGRLYRRAGSARTGRVRARA